MSCFYFLRHAQTEANAQQIMCGGGVDTILTELGIAQANQTRDILMQFHSIQPISTIVHSDMQRTRHTATIVNHHLQLPMQAMSDLKEHVVGDWEGRNWEEICQDYTNFKDPPNGELFFDFKSRIRTSIDIILKQFNSPLIVAHGGVWRAFIASYDLRPSMHPGNAELYFFEKKSDGLFPWSVYRCHDSFHKELIEI